MEHLRKWTTDMGRVAFRLDLWDTGRVDDRGSSELRYALAIIPDNLDTRPIVFDGEKYWPSPMNQVDGNETAADLLGFFSAYAEEIRFGDGPGEDMPDFDPRQRNALVRYADDLSVWQNTLDPES